MSGRLLLTLLAFERGIIRHSNPWSRDWPESRVRVLIYEDLQCPDCAEFRRMMDDKILPRYATRVAFVHRDFPLAKHAWARKAAVAARYFGERKPELGLAFRRQTMAGIEQTTPDNFKERLAQFARANGVDPAAAVAALEDASPRVAGRPRFSGWRGARGGPHANRVCEWQSVHRARFLRRNLRGAG